MKFKKKKEKKGGNISVHALKNNVLAPLRFSVDTPLCSLLADISLFCIFVSLIKAIHLNWRPGPVDVLWNTCMSKH